MKRTAVILMFIAILMKIIGFSREILISYYYGASYISDAYLIALTIPGTIYTIIGTGLLSGYIPMYNCVEIDGKEGEADRFTSNFINLILLGCGVMIVIIYLFTRQIISVFASGFEGEVLELTVKFTRICSLSIFFTGVVSVYNGYLQIRKKFLLPALMSLPFNICIIISILLSHRYNQYLAYGSVAAELSQFLFLFPIVYHCGFRHRPTLALNNIYLKQTIRLSIPIIIGVSINQINILVDKTIASQLVEGGISALNYASKLNGTIQGVFIMSVIAVIFPAMSQMAAGDRLDEMKSYIQKAVMLTILFLIPVTVGIMLFAKPIIILLYARGAFVTSAINLTSASLFFYSIGMLGFGLREIFSRAFYSLQNTRTPMINALIGILINIILNLALSHFMGIAGLALATSIAACITTILLYMSLTRKIGALIGKQGFVDCLKILIASSLMGILARIFYTLLYPSLGWNSSLIITVMVGAFIYLILIYCMKITYVNEFATGTWEYLRGCKGIQTLILMLKLRRRVCEPSPDYDTVLSSGNGITGVVRARRGAPFIGIVIVTYNNADGLRLMLEQIRNQSFLRYRVFIIDNGSTGNTREYIRGYLERNRNINYYRININLGRAGGFHYGIKLAYDQGAVAIWGLEDNVIPHRYALEALIYESRRLEGKFCLISNTTDRFDRERITDIRSREFRLLRISDITFRGVFIPRIMVDEIGLPRKELYRYFDDLDYSRRALDKGYTFYRVRDSLLLYQEEKEEVRCIKLLRKSYEIPLRSKVDWYYYMRNNRLMHSYREKDKAFRRGQFDLLIGILIVSPNCIPAAMDGLRDGRKGITGRSERYHD